MFVILLNFYTVADASEISFIGSSNKSLWLLKDNNDKYNKYNFSYFANNESNMS